MGLYNLDIEAQFGEEYFSNRYVLFGDGIESLLTPAETIVNAFRSVLTVRAQVIKYRVSDQVKNTDLFIAVPVNQPGLRGASNTTMMPLFCTARVDFAVATGRPSRKFLRGVLQIADMVDVQEIALATRQFINTNYSQVVSDLPQYVDVDGQAIVSGAVNRYASDRQLRRGSKRKAKPIL